MQTLTGPVGVFKSGSISFRGLQFLKERFIVVRNSKNVASGLSADRQRPPPHVSLLHASNSIAICQGRIPGFVVFGLIQDVRTRQSLHILPLFTTYRATTL